MSEKPGIIQAAKLAEAFYAAVQDDLDRRSVDDGLRVNERLYLGADADEVQELYMTIALGATLREMGGDERTAEEYDRDVAPVVIRFADFFAKAVRAEMNPLDVAALLPAGFCNQDVQKIFRERGAHNLAALCQP